MAKQRPALSAAQNKAMAYWGVIELAAQTGATTADLWSWIHDEAERLNLDSPGVSAIAVGQLRGMAGQLVERGRLFSNLRDNQRVTDRVIGMPPWARPLDQQKALPKFAVRFQHSYTQHGNLITEWRTSMFAGKVNHTAAQLRRLVELDAENMARKYRTAHVGVDDLQVMAV